MKKIISYLLVMALVLMQVSPLAVFAEETDGVNNGSIQEDVETGENSGEIKITGTKVNKSYTIYQVLELESFDDEKQAYTYNAASTAWNAFLNSDAALEYLSYNEVTGVWTWIKVDENGNEIGAQEFAQLALEYAKANDIAPSAAVQTAETDGEVLTFSNLELGYYLVDSTTGALCILTTTHAKETVTEKNDVPTVDKTVKEDSLGTYGDSNTEDIGSTVYFETKIDVKPGAENYVLVDVMSNGLTLNTNSFEVVFRTTNNEGKIVETALPTTAYTVYTSGDKLNVSYGETSYTATFVIEFDNTYMATLEESQDIYVKYNAVLNTGAVVESTGNPNETWLEYGSDNETFKDTTITYTLSFDVIKKDSEQNNLTGAEFELYRSSNGTDKINLVKISDGKYRIATAEEANAQGFVSAIIEAGTVEIIGLDADVYYLEEIKAPEGFNKLTSRIKVTVGSSMANDNVTINATVSGDANNRLVNYTNDDVTVINYNGSLLPSTGGMGTVLFITIGSIMVLGFGVLLVTKLRMSKMSI